MIITGNRTRLPAGLQGIKTEHGHTLKGVLLEVVKELCIERVDEKPDSYPNGHRE